MECFSFDVVRLSFDYLNKCGPTKAVKSEMTISVMFLLCMDKKLSRKKSMRAFGELARKNYRPTLFMEGSFKAGTLATKRFRMTAFLAFRK